jgi:hypothetical protein
MISKGIIDPTKVARAALQGAASTTGLLFCTEAIVADLPQRRGADMPGGAGGIGRMEFSTGASFVPFLFGTAEIASGNIHHYRSVSRGCAGILGRYVGRRLKIRSVILRRLGAAPTSTKPAQL